MKHLVSPFATSNTTPALAAAAGERTSYPFFEFFTAQITYAYTRRAYPQEKTPPSK